MRRALITLGAVVAFVPAVAAAASGWTVNSNSERVRIHGCAAEDSCTIDYRGDRHGDGVWVITRTTP